MIGNAKGGTGCENNEWGWGMYNSKENGLIKEIMDYRCNSTNAEKATTMIKNKKENRILRVDSLKRMAQWKVVCK